MLISFSGLSLGEGVPPEARQVLPSKSASTGPRQYSCLLGGGRLPSVLKRTRKAMPWSCASEAMLPTFISSDKPVLALFFASADPFRGRQGDGFTLNL